MLKTKSAFFMVMILGSLITLFSNSWISMWMGLEINMMSFIPLMKSKMKKTSEAIMIYFLVQSMSSALLMFSIITSYMKMNSSMMLSMIMFSTLMIKMGAAPFHMWVPEIMSKMSWKSCIMLMTWQKLAPMSMTMNSAPKSELLMMTVVMSVIVGSIGGINQTSLRKIMAYSSINHLGWMLTLNKIQNNWMSYLIMYSIMVMMICTMFSSYNMLFINQINSMNLSMMEKTTIVTSMMSLGGLPPFLGFLPKWMVIQILVENNMYMMLLIMIISSLVTLFYYMRTMTYMIMQQSTVNKWLLNKSNQKLIKYMILVNFSLPLMMIMNLL
nr:NADH dehydrogenase subunit 2 [Megacopta lobata]UYA97824.1 NADH dehydrogenase subunit 2 [Megacopta lobata]